MRDYENMIQSLRYCASNAAEKCETCPRINRKNCNLHDFMLEEANAIEELLAAVPHWISVEDELPRPFVSVLVQIPGEKPFPTVKEAFLEKTGMWYSIGFRYELEEATHWCEMPEPPKEVE